jgi:hypothetical protein
MEVTMKRHRSGGARQDAANHQRKVAWHVLGALLRTVRLAISVSVNCAADT